MQIGMLGPGQICMITMVLNGLGRFHVHMHALGWIATLILVSSLTIDQYLL